VKIAHSPIILDNTKIVINHFFLVKKFISMYFVFYFNRLAFSYLRDYQKAVSCYKKACELDPENQGYQRNYQLTLNNLHTNPGPPPSPPPPPPPSQSPNDPIIATPNLMETAARIMNDNPEVSTVYAIVFY